MQLKLAKLILLDKPPQTHLILSNNPVQSQTINNLSDLNQRLLISDFRRTFMIFLIN